MVCSIEISEVSCEKDEENEVLVTQGENPTILKILLNQFFVRTFYESTQLLNFNQIMIMAKESTSDTLNVSTISASDKMTKRKSLFDENAFK